MLTNLPQWRQELKASQKKEGNSSTSRWIQIATVDSNNRPRVRTVVFRGWLTDYSIFIFTDKRSEKIKELKENKNIEILWLLKKSKSQFRFKGIVNSITNENSYWDKLNDKSKETWLWPHPGQKFTSAKFEVETIEFKPNNFAVLKISIESVDLLKLTHPIHQRYIWEAKNNWLCERVNP